KLRRAPTAWVADHHGDVSRHWRPPSASQRPRDFWRTKPPLLQRSSPHSEVATCSRCRLSSAVSGGVEFVPGSSFESERANDADDNGLGDGDEGHHEGDNGDGGDYGYGDPSLGLGAGAEPSPPLPSEASWAVAAKELTSGMVEDDDAGAGVDLELLEMPPGVLTDDDDVDPERLDISDFLGPDGVDPAAVGARVAKEEKGAPSLHATGGRAGLTLGLDASNVLEPGVGADGLGVKEVDDGMLDPFETPSASSVLAGRPQSEFPDTGAAAAAAAAAAAGGDGANSRKGGETTKRSPGENVQGQGRSRGDIGGLEGLSADEVERRLISAGILREDGAELDLEEYEQTDEGEAGAGVFNEIEVSDGEAAVQILEERLGFDEEGIAYLRSKYPPLRGELWYRREPTSGSKTGKKFLDVFFLEETLPDLLDLLLREEGGEKGDGGVGLAPEQVKEMLIATPSLLGVEASDANDVVSYLRSELGLRGKGQLASALTGCPPMLMYHTWDNLRKKVSYYREALAWTNEEVAAMLPVFPNLLSIKMENDVIEIIDYLRTEIGLQPFMVSKMIRECPPLLEVRPKRLKAVVKYLWKVLEIPRSAIAVLLSQHPRACFLEAEANLAPLRQFFERELFVEDTSRIGYLVYKFPRLLFQDVETQLVPRAEEFRKAMGLEGLEPLPPRIRPRPKRNNYREEHAVGGRNNGYDDRGSSGRGRRRGEGSGSGSGRPRSSNSSGSLGGRGGRGSRSGAGRARSANSGFG
ncbi:unnamed protein product, partial [Pylaiella littoralis]